MQLQLIEEKDLEKNFIGYALITDKPDRYGIIAFSNDYGNTWNIHSSWIIPEDEAEAFNENHFNPEEDSYPPYMKQESWVYGNTYWEDFFSTGTKERCDKMGELFAAGDGGGIIEHLKQILKECLDRGDV